MECHVESKPGATNFRWAFNGTGELVEITSGYRTTADGSISVLRYTPRSELDFGTLLCWAANPLGIQSQPCVYHFYAAGNDFLNSPFPRVTLDLMIGILLCRQGRSLSLSLYILYIYTLSFDNEDLIRMKSLNFPPPPLNSGKKRWGRESTSTLDENKKS